MNIIKRAFLHYLVIEKMAEQYTFIINDDSVLNSYGFRVLTSGINVKQYKKNPLVLYLHKKGRVYSSNEERFPIGKAVKLWKEGSLLYATVEFDENDDFAKRIESKVDGGFLNMASIGVTPIEFSDKPKYILEGQNLKTVIKSDLEEISIVDFGSNPNALKVRLYDECNDIITLSKDSVNSIVPAIESDEEKTLKLQKQNEMNFKELVCKKLGMDANSTDDAVITALSGKITLAKQAEEYKTKIDQANEKAVIALVDENQDKKFTAEKREHFLTMGKQHGVDYLKNTLDAMSTMIKPKDVINPGSETPNEEGKQTLTFAKLKEQGKDAVIKLRKEDPKEYIRLFKAEYGFEPRLSEDE